MRDEQLCRLALAAIDDADARVVLADAIEESGWWDERYARIAGAPWPTDRARVIVNLNDGWETPLLAIAAVLLFGDWPTSWPLAERCRLPGYRWSPDFVAPISEPREFPRDAVGDD